MHNAVVLCTCACECLATLTLKCNPGNNSYYRLSTVNTIIMLNKEVNKKQHYCMYVQTKLLYQMRPRSCSSKIQQVELVDNVESVSFCRQKRHHEVVQ